MTALCGIRDPWGTQLPVALCLAKHLMTSLSKAAWGSGFRWWRPFFWDSIWAAICARQPWCQVHILILAVSSRLLAGLTTPGFCFSRYAACVKSLLIILATSHSRLCRKGAFPSQMIRNNEVMTRLGVDGAQCCAENTLFHHSLSLIGSWNRDPPCPSHPLSGSAGLSYVNWQR